jgi:hypothetical protein
MITLRMGKWKIQRGNKKILLVGAGGGDPSGKNCLKGLGVVEKPISTLNSKGIVWEKVECVYIDRNCEDWRRLVNTAKISFIHSSTRRQ